MQYAVRLKPRLGGGHILQSQRAEACKRAFWRSSMEESWSALGKESKSCVPEATKPNEVVSGKISVPPHLLSDPEPSGLSTSM